MAVRRKKPVKKLKFELTKSAVAGIGVIVCCLFLWMFLLGVWAGQSLLTPSSASKQATATVEGVTPEVLVIKAEKKAIKKNNQ